MMHFISRVVILLLVVNNSLQAQFSDTLSLNDGSELIGMVKILTGNRVFYKTDKKKGKKFYKYDSIKSIAIVASNGKVRKKYFPKRTKRKNQVSLFQKMISGKLEYFFTEKRDQNGMVTKTFYMGKANENFVTLIKYGPRFKKFQKIIDEFLGDCDDLVNKIHSNSFGQDIQAIPKIVRYYNNNCE